MFDSIYPSNEEERTSLYYPISYLEAIKRKPKPKNHILTIVSWQDVPNEVIEWETLKFQLPHGGKSFSMAVAVDLSLPEGYEMYSHSSWEELWDWLTDWLLQEEDPINEHYIYKSIETLVDKWGEGRFQSLVNLVSGSDYFSENYAEWCKNNPDQGGFFIFDDEEEGQGTMNFSRALQLLKEGKSLTRSGWNGKGMYIKVQFPDTNSKMTLPYIFMKTVDDEYVPWLASQSDLLAEDWEEFS